MYWRGILMTNSEDQEDEICRKIIKERTPANFQPGSIEATLQIKEEYEKLIKDL